MSVGVYLPEMSVELFNFDGGVCSVNVFDVPLLELDAIKPFFIAYISEMSVFDGVFHSPMIVNAIGSCFLFFCLSPTGISVGCQYKLVSTNYWRSSTSEMLL